jgi:diguanylate cyclase (GGDEF)-like protein
MTYLMITFLVTNLRATIESEKLLSRTDALTGLLNPRAFYEAGRAELSRSLRHNRIMTCLGVDVDNFKLINDKLGHATGDHALKLIGDSFRKSLRASDLAARVGGDEFCILLPETDGEGAKVVIDRIRQQISVASFGKLFISVGCVTFKIIPESVDVMLRETDLAMYTAKGKGGGQVAYVDLTQFSTPPEIISSNQMRSVSAKESS